MDEQEVDELIKEIEAILCGPESNGTKAREIVLGILIPTTEEIHLNFRILERTLNLPRQ